MHKIGVVLGTGPSLAGQREQIIEMRKQDKIRIYGINRTFEDFPVDVLICCDPSFHAHYGKMEGDFDHYHWDKAICDKYGYKYIEGRWEDGLSTDPNYISFGHSSGWQALNLAVHHGCEPILLAGYDMSYDSATRHYFTGLSEVEGEYPEPLRKWSLFDKPDKTGLLYDYAHIADQCRRGEVPAIYNCTARSALKCFPMRELSDFA